MTRPKALFAMARLPWPMDTGARIRAWHILSGFTKIFDVDVLAYGDPAHDNGWDAQARSLGLANVTLIPHPDLDSPMRPALFLRGVMRGLPGSVLKYQTPAFLHAFQEALQRTPALVHFEHVHIAHLLPRVRALSPTSRVTLDAHNIEWHISQRMREVETSPLRKAALALHTHSMRRFETKTFQQCHRVLAVSAEDAAAVATMTRQTTRCDVVENGVDPDYFSPGNDTAITPGAMAFIGSMDWLPNVDAMVWFCKEVLPAIRNARSDVTLSIVGRNPDPAVRALHSPEAGIEVTGTVDDVRPYVRRAAVVIAPLRFGGGTRLKILEAFAMGKAMVSTALGCEGIACKDGEHLLVRDSPQGLAEACLELLDSASSRQSIGEQARGLALEKYSWAAITQRMRTGLLEEVHLL